jgi:hypothetical protein
MRAAINIQHTRTRFVFYALLPCDLSCLTSSSFAYREVSGGGS